MSTKKVKPTQQQFIKGEQEKLKREKAAAEEYKKRMRPFVKFLKTKDLRFHHARVGQSRIEYFRLDEFEKILSAHAAGIQANEDAKAIAKQIHDELIYFKRPSNLKAKYPDRLEPVSPSDLDKKYACFRFDTTDSKKWMMWGIILTVLFLVLFPIWPFQLKYAIWLISFYLLIFLVGLIVIRLVIYLICAIFGFNVWILPNLLSDQGFVQSLKPLICYERWPTWKIIEITNKSVTPGQRYGHTMVFNKPYLVVFGGNSGNKAENDVWLLNINKGPFQWQKYEFQSKICPSPRVYHSAAICEEGSALGMMVIFGGRKQTKKDQNSSQRDANGCALNDIWGLRKHRDGSWDWVTPPKSQSYSPIGRYQHLVTFAGSTLVIVGGRSNLPEETVDTIEMYDTESSQWSRVSSLSRYRHAIALYNKTQLFVHGGFEPQQASQPLDTMAIIDFLQLTSKPPASKQNLYMENSLQSNLQQRIQTQRKELRQIGESERNMSNNSRVRGDKLNRSKLERGERDLTPSRIINSSKSIRLSNQVVIAKGDNNQIQIQKMNVNELMEESKKLTSIQEDSQVYDQTVMELVDNVINVLMPNQPNLLKNFTLFPFKKDKINRLCQEASRVLSEETSLVCARSPTKIFGSIYGRFQDLLNIFENFGYPDEKEMEIVEYVFLGNYVDKGFNSLETVCLLMALKIKYPDHIRLLRGKHEDPSVNRICGFGEECTIRLGENINDPSSCFNAINGLFELMPLAVAIEDRYLCVNSGIGSIQDLVAIKDVVRPVKVKSNQIVTDLLWSEDEGSRDLNYTSRKSTEDEIESFLDKNGLETIISTKDGLVNGFENERMLSICSIPNNTNPNGKGCILKVTKEHEIAPCIVTAGTGKKTLWVNELNTKASIVMNENEVNFRKKMFEAY